MRVRKNIFRYSSKVGWHSMCLFTLERGQLETCQRESDQQRQQDLVLCGEFTTSRKITSRRARSVRRVLPADTNILTCSCSRGWTARWWRCLGLARKGHTSYFWHRPQTWFLRWCFAAREVRKCILNKNTQKQALFFHAIWSTFYSPLLFDYHYVLLTVTGMSTLDHLDLELQAKEGAGPLPGVWVAPAEHPPVTDLEVGEFGWPHYVWWRW